MELHYCGRVPAQMMLICSQALKNKEKVVNVTKDEQQKCNYTSYKWLFIVFLRFFFKHVVYIDP